MGQAVGGKGRADPVDQVFERVGRVFAVVIGPERGDQLLLGDGLVAEGDQVFQKVPKLMGAADGIADHLISDRQLEPAEHLDMKNGFILRLCRHKTILSLGRGLYSLHTLISQFSTFFTLTEP